MLDQYDEGYPILNPVTEDRIYLKQMLRRQPRGTYVCSCCYFQTDKNKSKSAVMLACGISPKQCLHARHFSKTCGESALHRELSLSVKIHFSEHSEPFYPGSSYKADAMNGSTFYEIVHTSEMSDAKRDHVKGLIKSSNIEVLILRTKNIPRGVVEDLWEAWVESKKQGNDDWASYWFDSIEEYFKKYTPKSERDPGAPPFIPSGTDRVRHYEKVSKCTRHCMHAIGVNDARGQNSLLYSCKLSNMSGDTFDGNECGFGLGEQEYEN